MFGCSLFGGESVQFSSGVDTTQCGSPSTVGFDCTGLVLYSVYEATGGAVITPHSSAIQTFTSGRMTSISLNQSAWQPGDVIVFGGGQHAGIYIGNGNLLDADTAYYVRPDGVHTQPISWLTHSPSLQVTRVLRFS